MKPASGHQCGEPRTYDAIQDHDTLFKRLAPKKAGKLLHLHLRKYRVVQDYFVAFKATNPAATSILHAHLLPVVHADLLKLLSRVLSSAVSIMHLGLCGWIMSVICKWQ